MYRRLSMLLVLSLTACQTTTVFTVEPQADTPVASPTDTAAPLPETAEPTEDAAPAPEGPPWCVDQPALAEPTSASFRIAYAEAGQLWILDEGLPPRSQAQAEGITRVRLSDDGQLAAYTQAVDDYRVDMFAIDLQTGTSTLLIDAETFDAMAADLPQSEFGPHGVEPANLQFIPGTHTLIFRASPLYSALGGFGINDLWLVDADTGESREILPPGEGGQFQLSDDGSQFALIQQQRLQFYDIEGTPLLDANVDFMTGIGLGESLLFPTLSWTDDNQAVLVPNLAEDRGTLSLWRLPLDGGEAEILNSVEDVPMFQNDLSPNFELMLTIPGQTTLIITDVETGVRQAYMNEESISLIGWAPDSVSFLFETLADPNSIDPGYRTTNLAIGHICAAPRPFTTLPDAIREDLFTESIYWLDSTRFILVRRAITETRGELALPFYLGSIDGTLQELARPVGEVIGDQPPYAVVVMPGQQE